MSAGPTLEAGVRTLARRLWRGVEAQHLVATMKLVDSLAEQDLLEQILDESKPPLPPEASVPMQTAATVSARIRACTT